MAASLSNPSYAKKLSDTPTTPATASFDEFAQSRAINGGSSHSTDANGSERLNVGTSFAIPSNASIIEFLKKTAEPITNKFMLAPPSASSINIRRNSTQNGAIHGQNSTSNNNNENGSFKMGQQQQQQPFEAAAPPIPKRTFLGKIIQSSLSETTAQSPTATIKTTFNNVCKQTLDEVKRRNVTVMLASKPSTNQNSNQYQNQNQIIQRRLVENHYPIDQYSDDDRLSIESSVFEEPKSSDPIISLSNRSSSESNKSQTTIDTGYMSASNDTDRIFFGASEDFRSRFSSVDTQSSIDSCTSSDLQTHQAFTLQNQAKCIISPLAVKRDEYEDKFNGQQLSHGKHFNRFNSSNSLLSVSNKSGAITSDSGSSRARMPLLVARNQSMSKIMQSSLSSPARPAQSPKTRPPMPQPTVQPQNPLDSGRILYNGSMLGAFQNGLAKIQSAAATTSEVVMGRRSFKKASQYAHTKLTKRHDSSISNDSFSLNASPSYNTKNLDAPLLANVTKNNRTSCLNGQDDVNDHGNDSFTTNKFRKTIRQDSVISNGSYNQTSNPNYNAKLLEQPLIAHNAKLHAMKKHLKRADEITKENFDVNSVNSAIIKSASTPASLQAVVRFQNGSNMSLQHKVINRRKSSNPYITRGILKFRLLQILLNALALLIIAGGLAAYFRAYPTVKFINKTIITPQRLVPSATIAPITEPQRKPIIPSQFDKNPAPGICLPIIVKFCQNHHVPYNYTIYPNYIGHFSQIEAEEDLEPYEAIVDVQCYELASLFLCTLFVPKCGTAGLIPPCKSLCSETMRRCHFFFNVFGLELPDYLSCNQFTDSNNPDICVGQKQMREAYNRASKPVCSGFSCDNKTRCIPSDWRCDGHVDCLDQSDEAMCNKCSNDTIYCGNNRCMSSQHVCDGEINCPYGQDERNCVRLSERNGDLGKGTLEIYKVSQKKWVPACVDRWNPATSPTIVCSLLGYNSVNSSRLTMPNTNQSLPPPINSVWRMYQRKKNNLIKEFGNCMDKSHAIVDLTCSNYECGRVRERMTRPQTRIVGGSESSPGDWPFLAAILGGPEEIFYCAGVLISDQWVLTASHCIGNKSLHSITNWTIQLGITRRNSHTYYGQKVKVQRVIPHPHYNLDVMHDNDIALFQLATRVAFHEHLLPVCLPPPSIREIKPGTLCTVIGWGKKEDKKPSTPYEPTVNEVDVPILNRNLCNEWLVHLNVTDGMICAGYSEGGKDACQGDSGGPLLCRDSGDRERYFVAGIVSWGVKCANPKLPGVYANVPKYMPWILRNMRNYSNAPIEYPNRSNIYRSNKLYNRQHRQES